MRQSWEKQKLVKVNKLTNSDIFILLIWLSASRYITDGGYYPAINVIVLILTNTAQNNLE